MGGLPFPPTGDLHDPVMDLHLHLLYLWHRQVDSLPLSHLGSPPLSLEVSKASGYIHSAYHYDIAELGNVLANSFGGDFFTQGFGKESKYTIMLSHDPNQAIMKFQSP